MSDNILPEYDNPNAPDIISAEKLIGSLNSLVKIILVHKENNQMVVDCVNNFVRNVRYFTEKDEELTIQIINDRFYFQDEKLVVRKKSEALINSMLQFFQARGIEKMNVFSSIATATAGHIIRFARLLNQAEHHDKPLEWLIEELEDDLFRWVEIEKASDEDLSEENISSIKPIEEETEFQEKKAQGRKNYSYAMASIREVGENILAGKRSGTRKCIRVVQNMVDNIIEDESIYFGLTTIRVYDDYTYTHSVNVSILCMCLGKYLGLSKPAMVKLGVSALFHDLGKILLPPEILNKPEKLNHEEIEEIQKHPLNSVRMIFKLKISRGRKGDILLAPFEHHLQYNLKGYPFVDWRKPISLIGRILAIADVYDALTSVRAYRDYAITPDRALAKMLKNSGKIFDPILLKAFISMLGIYPIGSLLLLDTGELGLVSAVSETKEMDRPKLILLDPVGSKGYQRGKEIDLAERDPNNGSFLRNIYKSIHPSEKGIQPAQFLF